MFVSCNLVSQEIFDALKQNGADVFICCDPSRNGGNDYDVISLSIMYEMFHRFCV